MVDKASGSGSAHNAAVKVENNVPELEAALADARAKQEARLPRMRVEGARSRVKKAKAALAGAEDALKAAQQAEKDGR